jgi:hypothetical protein
MGVAYVWHVRRRWETDRFVVEGGTWRKGYSRRISRWEGNIKTELRATGEEGDYKTKLLLLLLLLIQRSWCMSPRIPSSTYHHHHHHYHHHILLHFRYINSTLHSISAEQTLCPQCCMFHWTALSVAQTVPVHDGQGRVRKERSWPRTSRYPNICLGLRSKNKKIQDSLSGLRVEAGAPGKKQSIYGALKVLLIPNDTVRLKGLPFVCTATATETRCNKPTQRPYAVRQQMRWHLAVQLRQLLRPLCVACSLNTRLYTNSEDYEVLWCSTVQFGSSEREWNLKRPWWWWWPLSEPQISPISVLDGQSDFNEITEGEDLGARGR